jgi:hypothetical protein
LSKDIFAQIEVRQYSNPNKIRLVGSNSTNNEGEAYIRYIFKYLVYHNIFQKIEGLKELLKTKKKPK